MNTPENISASVKARLQNVAAIRGEDFNLLLLRYGIERLLFRLSQSPHADRFLLKGAMLFVVWDEKTHRPTRDLDLLGFGSTEKADLIQVFAAVAAVPVVDDGIVFDPKSVQATDIREDNAYGGVRIRLLGKLGTAEVPVQIDVGAGDVVTPAPERATFPAPLDFPAPQIRTYPVYTVVAEKFEAMVKLGIANTRMKDFTTSGSCRSGSSSMARRCGKPSTQRLPAGKRTCHRFPKLSPMRSPTIRPNRCSGPRSCAATA